ncbi:MAG: calcium-binding protein [Pirellulales bacterium]
MAFEIGDELHGGSGNDFIYGSIRRNWLYGDEGDETIYGDALAGPNYAPWQNQAYIGGDDSILGGSGFDRLFGGGGNDKLYGGFDSDLLEGQNGIDSLYGGPGIDKLVFDTDPLYAQIPSNQFETFDGHGPFTVINGQEQNVVDDNATDILIISGTDVDDTIRIGQVEVTPSGTTLVQTKLAVQISHDSYNRVFTANWRQFNDPQDSNGVPLIEQFQVTGLGGDDRVEFVSTPQPFFISTTPIFDVKPLDVSDLISRSDDWVTVVNAGDGNDVVVGSNARDRLDGGRGDDVIYGFAGDDQLWGDGGPEQGESDDHDRLFAGSGNDDLIGGQGTNQLFAWSFDPNGGLGELQLTNMQPAVFANNQFTLTGNFRLPTGGVLHDDAVFSLALGSGLPVKVRVPSDSNNTTLADLVADVNTALAATSLSGLVNATLSQGRLVLTSTQSMVVSPAEDFGVYVNSSGTLFTDGGDHIGAFDDSGNPIGDGILDEDQNITGPKRPARTIQDTGLNRVMGGPRADGLYGGTGLDFLFGNGAVSGTDAIFDRRGNSFESFDSGLAGDEWKQYAKSTSKVWYYGGSNLDDVITVDYVTEPGLLQQRHLITRLSNNGGNFSFDARLNLDFEARDASGKLIWNPNDSWYGEAVIGARSLNVAQAVSQPVLFSISLDGAAAAPVSVDLTNATATQTSWLQAIQRALELAGLSGKVNARLSDGKLALTRLDGDGLQQGRSMTVVTTNDLARDLFGLSDGQQSTVGLVGERGLAGLLPPEGDFQAIIVDALDGNDTINVGPTVTKSVWSDGGKGNDRIIHAAGSAILIDHIDSLKRNDSRETAFDLDSQTPGNEAGVQHNWRTNLTITGLSLDSPTDQDWFKFQVEDASQLPTAADYLKLTSLSTADGMQLKLITANNSGQFVEIASSNASGLLRWPSNGLQLNKAYWLKVFSNAKPTRYQIEVGTTDWAEPNNSASTAFDLTREDYRLQRFGTISGLRLNTASDEDWFEFELDQDIPGDSVNDSLNLLLASGQAVRASIYSLASSTASVSKVADASKPYLKLSLAGLVAGKYRLRVQFESPNSSSLAEYELQPRIASSIGTLTLNNPETMQGEFRSNNPPRLIDMSSQVKVVRRDVLLGGSGDDILVGGSFEDWIIGGDGNDVLSGGKDRQAQDLMWGGAGDDIFQLYPDQMPLLKSSRSNLNPSIQQTLVTTQSDRFDGGAGNDQVLYLGGDFDASGRTVPDFVAVTYDPLVRRNAATSRVWDTANQQWILDPVTGEPRQDFAFFTTTSVEQWVIDTQAGNDEVHADSEYKIPGAYSGGVLEWGMKDGAAQQGALVPLVIRGGVQRGPVVWRAS